MSRKAELKLVELRREIDSRWAMIKLDAVRRDTYNVAREVRLIESLEDEIAELEVKI